MPWEGYRFWNCLSFHRQYAQVLQHLQGEGREWERHRASVRMEHRSRHVRLSSSSSSGTNPVVLMRTFHCADRRMTGTLPTTEQRLCRGPRRRWSSSRLPSTRRRINFLMSKSSSYEPITSRLLLFLHPSPLLLFLLRIPSRNSFSFFLEPPIRGRPTLGRAGRSLIRTYTTKSSGASTFLSSKSNPVCPALSAITGSLLYIYEFIKPYECSRAIVCR